MDDDFGLMRRIGLPEALQVLLAAFPRAHWQEHRNFAGLVQFWLDRHMTFRQLLSALQTDAQQAVDGVMAPDRYRLRLSQMGGMLVNQLHGHHQIEDLHYFPVLTRMETRLSRGFDILDRDHHDLDDLLDRFVRRANETLQGAEAGRMLTEVEKLGPFLTRHLDDEEDLIVPVILKHGPDALH